MKSLSIFVVAIEIAFGCWPAMTADILPRPTMAPPTVLRLAADEIGRAPHEMFDKPKTIVELFKNIKLAIDSGYLLNDAFYSEGSLARMLGGSEVLIRRGEERQHLAIEAFDDQPVSHRRQIDVFPPAPVDQLGHADDKVKRNARIEFGVDAPVEDLVTVFGKATDVADYPGRNFLPPKPLMEQTHSLGNKRIVYRLEAPTASVTVQAVTRGDGLVTLFDARAVEK